MAKTNQRAQRLISVSQSRFESEAGPQLSARPTSIQSESRLLWADFSKQRKQNKSGIFKRCKAARNHLLPLLTPVTPFPFPPDQSQNKADLRFHPPPWNRERGVAQQSNSQPRRLENRLGTLMRCGTLFRSLSRQWRIPPQGVTCPAPWGGRKLKTKTRGLVGSRQWPWRP